MNWIKKNYDQFALAVFAVTLLGFSVAIVLQTQGFPAKFAGAYQQAPKREAAPGLDLSPLLAAQESLKSPKLWMPKEKSGELFVAERQIIDPQTKLPRPLGGDDGFMVHPPVPDKWILKYNLDLLSNTVLTDDPDKDGFTTLEEFLGKDRVAGNGDTDSTNPTDPKSRPPLYVKLFVKQYIKIPFRLKFNSYDGDPARDKPENMSFAINTLSLSQPTEFLKLGEKVRNTDFKLIKFVHKVKVNPSTGAEDDVSELTLLNTESNEEVVLVLTKVTDSPDSFALFNYVYPHPAKEIRVKKRQNFVLLPEQDVKYKLIDINQTGALIGLPNGETYTVPYSPK